MSSLVAAPADARPLARREKLALAAEILVAYTRARWWMRRRDLPGALRALRAPAHGVAAPPADGTPTGRRLGRAVVTVLAALPTDSRCLVRSLVLTNLLARRGIESRLVLGVRPGESFAAHAWVEHDSTPLLDPGDFESRRLAEL